MWYHGCMGRKPAVKVGDRFHYLEVLENLGPIKKGGDLYWRCKCDCGGYTDVSTGNLRREHVMSCGCWRRQQMSESKSTHRETNTRLYRIWNGMKNRCSNPKAPGYKNYGGRGIYVCSEWNNSFEAFRDWAKMNGYEEHLTIDRVDNDGPYSPENCRWATYFEQLSNSRANRWIEIDGERKTIAQWSRDSRCSVAEGTIRRRIDTQGWDERDAVLTPQYAKAGQ